MSVVKVASWLFYKARFQWFWSIKTLDKQILCCKFSLFMCQKFILQNFLTFAAQGEYEN